MKGKVHYHKNMKRGFYCESHSPHAGSFICDVETERYDALQDCLKSLLDKNLNQGRLFLDIRIKYVDGK